MSTRIVRILAYVALIFGIVMSILGITLMIQSISEGKGNLLENMTTEVLFILFTVFAFVIIKRTKEIEQGHFINVKNKKDSLLDESINLIDQCIKVKNHKQVIKYFKNLKNLVITFKGKNYELDSSILDILNSSLQQYLEIADSPIKNTEQGKNIVKEIFKKLEIVTGAIDQIYRQILKKQVPDTDKIISEFHEKLEQENKPKVHNSKNNNQKKSQK